jgi:hypothetical protein
MKYPEGGKSRDSVFLSISDIDIPETLLDFLSFKHAFEWHLQTLFVSVFSP